ncbi:MAG: acyltransferase [Clostridia bacterium]|nr:acyltransferase [Clostridia bacterium]
MDKRISDNIYKLKFFAIISVICAHCCTVSATHSVAEIFTSTVLNSIGAVGVGIFMFISGYLFYNTKRDFKNFFASKLKTIVIPWVFCGSLVYFYVKLRKGGISVLDWIKWILGVDTYLYYLTVLFLLYLMCYFIRKNAIARYLVLVLSVISNILTAFGVIAFITPYLNPFNFSFFFILGLICAENNLLDKVFDYSRKICVYTTAMFIVIVIILAYFKINLTYFKLFYIPVELLAIVSALGIADFKGLRFENLLCDIGKLSFSIYLLHMPIAGIVANIFGRIDLFVLTLIRPIIVLIITYIGVKVLLMILKKTPFNNIINILIGTR